MRCFAAGSGELLAAIPAGHTAMSPVISPDGKRLYVCNRFDNDVSVIDLAAAREVARVGVVREPIAAAVAPDGRSVLVANHLPHARTDGDSTATCGRWSRSSTRGRQATTAIPLAHGANSLRGLCISPDGKHAFVTHLLSNFETAPIRVDGGWINTNVVSIIDLRRRKVVRTIGMDEYQSAGAGNPWDVACTADGKSVCVSLAGTHELCVIELADLLSESAQAHVADDGRLADLSGPGRQHVAADQAAGQRPARAGRRRIEGLRRPVLQRHGGRGRSADRRQTLPPPRSPWDPRRS